jgi:transcriptional regulator with XRE-family HTH domain
VFGEIDGEAARDRCIERRWRPIMETMERDPAYIASQVRLLRKIFRLTQENLADAAGLTTRTIEKVESGRHRPDEQTLRSLARALNMDVKVFEKPTPEQEARTRAEMDRAVRKTVFARTHPVHTANDFLNAFAQRHAFRFDTSQVEKDEVLEIAASMADWIRDLGDVWDDCSMSQRLEYARNFAQLCEGIEAHGYTCYMGHHGQQLLGRGQPPLVLDCGLMSIQKSEGATGPAGERYALVQLDGAWESLERDRVPIPPDTAAP